MRGNDSINRLANLLNRMSPGERITISRYQIQDLPGNFLSGENGWERTLGKVIGSAHATVWDFQTNPETGDITAHRMGRPDKKPGKIDTRCVTGGDREYLKVPR